jgi:hypothetical protein
MLSSTEEARAMDRIAYFADLSVRRASAFSTLAIGTMLIACSYQLDIAAKTGAILFSLQLAILLVFAERRYPGRAYRRTELWTLLGRKLDLGLPEERERQIIVSALRDTYLRYARVTAFVAAFFWLATTVLWVGHAIV